VSTSYSVYAPLRYEITRKGCQKIAEKYRHALQKTSPENFRSNILHDITSLTDIKQLGGPIESFKIIQKETEKLVSYIEFYSNARVIYDFHRILTQALLQTDVDKMSLRHIPRSQECCYLHFGDFTWPDGYPQNLEGVYVSFRSSKENGQSIAFNPIYKHQFATPLHINTDRENESGYFDIVLDDVSEGISVYLEELYAEVSENNESLLGTAVNAPDGFSEMFTMFSEAAMIDPGNPKVNSFIAKISINCLLYLSAVPEDVHDEWDDRAPRHLVEQSIHAEKPGTRKTAERTLANQLYIKVRMIGRKFTQPHETSGVTGSKKSTHIRKGHFRNQAYGHDWSEHRVIFIAPKIINPGDSDLPGRIYDI
jgi:hypothetical protein